MDEITRTDCLASPTYETARLMIRDSVPEECGLIQAINEESDYISQWVGWKTPGDYAYKLLTEGNLPPGGATHNFRAKTIYLRDTGEAIGVMEAYCGYPDPATLIIGWLFVVPKHQKQGYASEAAELIFSEAKAHSFDKVRLGVALKNWPGLRFWHSVGFSKIAGIIGDEICSDTTFATMILERDVTL